MGIALGQPALRPWHITTLGTSNRWDTPNRCGPIRQSRNANPIDKLCQRREA